MCQIWNLDLFMRKDLLFNIFAQARARCFTVVGQLVASYLAQLNSFRKKLPRPLLQIKVYAHHLVVEHSTENTRDKTCLYLLLVICHLQTWSTFESIRMIHQEKTFCDHDKAKSKPRDGLELRNVFINENEIPFLIYI